MKRTSILLALMLLVAAFGAAAALNKWVDEKGVTHYTETPPPGKKLQELQASPPVQNSPGLNRNAPDAKAQAVESRRNLPVLYDRNRLLGSWSTAPGASIQASVVFFPTSSTSGADTLVGQRWVRGEAMNFNGALRYRITIGGGGRGLLEAGEASDSGVPPKLAYSFDGATLILGISDGKYAGQHRLTKQR